jgi:anti-sigma-K factor RskA
MTESVHITQEDLALHAMQSLPDDEAAAIRGHLAECVLCRWQLAEVSGDLALLGMTADQQPVPREARERFLSQLARIPAGENSNTEREQPLQHEIVQEEEFDQQSSEKRHIESGGNRAGTLVEMPPATGRRRGAGFWTPWAIAAALAVVAIALGVQNAALNDTLRNESNMVTNLAVKASRAQQVLETLTSSHAQRVILTPEKTANEPAGRVTYLPERGGLIFQANNLKPLPAEKTYELWLIPSNGKPPIPAGLFRPDAAGTAGVVLPSLPSDVPAKAFGVTVEAAGGSDKPTAPILLAGNVPGV